MLDWNDYPNFSEEEFKCRCGCGKADMEPAFMARLQALRTKLGFPFTVTSGYRCQEYNASIGGGPEHVLGKACDLGVRGTEARLIVSHADAFPRVGVSQKGEGRFIHLGTATPDDGVPSPWIWSY